MEIAYSTEHLNILLILLGLAIAIHFASLRMARRRTLHFSNYALLRRVMGHRLFHKNYQVLVLRLLVLILIVLALSDIRFILIRPVADSDYVMVVDTSPSMSENFEPLSKTTVSFVGSLPKNTRLGLVTFAAEPKVMSGLTRDYATIEKGLINLSVGTPPGTSISHALIAASGIFDDANLNRTIMLITDGSTDENIEFELNRSFETMSAKNIRVLVFGLNMTYDDDYTIPEEYMEYVDNETLYRPELDEKTLSFIANQTGGEYYNIGSTGSLATTFDELIGKSQKTITIEATSYLIVVICVLLFMDWALGATRFKTLP